MRMQILDIITKKKLGQPLTREEITYFARGAADQDDSGLSAGGAADGDSLEWHDRAGNH